MKRSLLLTGAAVALIVPASCNRIEEVNNSHKDSGVPFEIVAKSPDVKTANDNLSTKWVTDDAINVFHSAGGNEIVSDGQFIVSDIDAGLFSGTVASNPVVGTAYDWYAIYPYDEQLTKLNGDNGTNRYYTIGSEVGQVQTQDGTGNMSHLAGEKLPLYGVKKASAYNGSAPFIQMNQLASVAAITITNKTPAAISVSSVSLTAPENIIGTYYINILGDNPTYTVSGADYVSETATLSVTNGNLAKDATGVYYIAIKPFTAQAGQKISVTVTTTSNGTQTKEFTLSKNYTFSPGKYKTVKMDFTNEQEQQSEIEEPDTDVYTLVEDLDNLTSGWYMIVNFQPANEDESFVLTNEKLTSKTQTAIMLKNISGLQISEDAKTITTDSDRIKWCFEAVGPNVFKIKAKAFDSNNNMFYNYLLCKDENTGLMIATWNYTSLQNTWTISTYDDTNKYVNLSTVTGTRTRYLETYLGEPDWRTYQTENQAYNYIRLYKKTPTLPAAGIGFDTSSYEFSLGDDEYQAFSGQELTNPNGVSVNWVSDNEGLATVSNGTVSFVDGATGSATISAIFTGNSDYQAATVSYTITVNAPVTGLKLPFTETFHNSGRASTFNNNETNPLQFDNVGWDVSNGAPHQGSAKFGTGSYLGKAISPALDATGKVTLSFLAAAWDNANENTTLKLSVTNGGIYSDPTCQTTVSSVTLEKGAWNTYMLYLDVATSPFTITFEGQNASKSRFFLDDINIVSGIVEPAPEFGATISNPEEVIPANGGTKTISVTGNVDWTVSATNGATVSQESGNGAKAITVTIPKNTDTNNGKTYNVTVSTEAGIEPNSYSFTISQDAATSSPNTVATISFSNKGVIINSASVTGKDDQNNTWTITTVGTTSFTPNADYCQVGSSSKPATSITFTTSLPESKTIKGMEAKFGGFSGTAGTVALKVGNTSIGSGSLNGTSDVTVTSSTTATGSDLTISVTGISKGVKVYYIKVTYE